MLPMAMSARSRKGKIFGPARLENWRRLLTASDRCTIFQDPLWAQRDHQLDEYPWILSDESFVAPIEFVNRNSTRTVRLIGGDYEDIVAEPGEELAAISRLLSQLESNPNWDICDFRSLLPQSTLLCELIDEEGELLVPKALTDESKKYHVKLLKHQRYSIVKAPSSWKEYEKVIGKTLAYKVRAEVNRRIKYFGSDGLRISRPETFDVDFDAFVTLHQKRWTEKGEQGQFQDSQSADSMRKFCRLLLERGQLRLYTVWFGDIPGGALLNFADHNRIYFYGCGFDPQFKKHHPVKVLIAKAIQDSIEFGPKIFDFMKGNEGYKADWANAHEQTYRLIIARKTIRGKLALAVLCAQARYQEKRIARRANRIKAEAPKKEAE